MRTPTPRSPSASIPLTFQRPGSHARQVGRSFESPTGTEMAVLRRMLEALESDADVDGIVREMLAFICSQVKVPFGSFWLYDEKRQLIKPHLALTLDEPSKTYWRRMSAERVPDFLLDLREPRIFEANADELAPYRTRLAEHGITTILSVPLRLGERLIGFVGLHGFGSHRFTSNDLVLAQQLAVPALFAAEVRRIAERTRATAIRAERMKIRRELDRADRVLRDLKGMFLEEDSATRTADALLTLREHDVLVLMGEGRSNKQIAMTLNISSSTAKVHVMNILRKLHATSRTEAVANAIHYGLI